MDWPEAAERLQRATQQPRRCSRANRSQEGALPKGGNRQEGPAPLKSRERDPHTSFLYFSLLFPPPPTVTLRGSLPPSGPAVTLAQRPVGGASQAPDTPPRSRPVSSPWERAGWVTDLAARHHHRACQGRCRCLRKKPRLPPGGGAVASATAAAAARGRS